MSARFAAFQVERKTENEIEIVSLSGNLNGLAFTKFEEVLLQLQIEKPVRVVLDCSGLTSLGTQPLVRCVCFARSFENGGRSLKIAGMRDKAVAFAQALGLAADIDWQPSVAAAEKAFTTKIQPLVAVSNKEK